MIKKLAGLLLVKKNSKRLANKNCLPFNGGPMFLTNVNKCLELFDVTYVSSDDPEILALAKKAGAVPIQRGEELCGDTPNIPVYQHALKNMTSDIEGIVAVQANSPTINKQTIAVVKRLIEEFRDEVMTCHEGGAIYGSAWGMTRERLENYGDPYHPNPDVKVVDISVDIHSIEDYNEALRQHKLIYE